MILLKSDLIKLIEILRSSSCVNTIVWLPNADLNKTPGAKTQRCCMLFWTNLGSSNLQTRGCTATLHLRNYPSKMSKTFWTSEDKPISDVLLWAPTHGHTSVDWLAKFYIHQLSTRDWMPSRGLAKGIER